MDKIKKSLSYSFSDSDIRLYLPNRPILEYKDLAKHHDDLSEEILLLAFLTQD